MMGIHCLIRLFVCAQLVCSVNSNVKLKVSWTNVTEYYSTTNAGTAIQHMEVLPGTTDVIFAENHCIRTKTGAVTGECGKPGKGLGHTGTYSNITWFTRFDDGSTLILDAAGLKEFDTDNLTHYFPKTTSLDISSVIRIDARKCILFTIKANSSLMEMCSSDLRIVESSLNSDYSSSIDFSNAAFFFTGNNRILKLDLMVKHGKTFIKQNYSFVLFASDFVNKLVNFTNGTKLYLENSCALVALDPKRKIVRWIDLNTHTVYALDVAETSNEISSILLVKKNLYIGYSNGTIAKGQITFHRVEEVPDLTIEPKETCTCPSPVDKDPNNEPVDVCTHPSLETCYGKRLEEHQTKLKQCADGLHITRVAGAGIFGLCIVLSLIWKYWRKFPCSKKNGAQETLPGTTECNALLMRYLCKKNVA